MMQCVCGGGGGGRCNVGARGLCGGGAALGVAIINPHLHACVHLHRSPAAALTMPQVIPFASGPFSVRDAFSHLAFPWHFLCYDSLPGDGIMQTQTAQGLILLACDGPKQLHGKVPSRPLYVWRPKHICLPDA